MSARYRYRGFGLLIESEIELPELPHDAAPAQPDLVVQIGAVPRDAPRATLREELAIHAAGAAFLVRNGNEIIVEQRAGMDSSTLRVLLLGRIMAFLFRQRGWLPLHASGVLIGGECVLFLGVARAGKSTTAAAFHRAGHAVITDDIAPVRVNDQADCVLQAGPSFVRLRDDVQVMMDRSPQDRVVLTTEVQAGKNRYDLDHNAASGKIYPVRCAYAISFGDTVRAEPVDPFRAIPLLSECSFVIHRRMTREAMEIHLRDCATITAALPLRRLFRPRSLSSLPALVNFVEEDLRALPQRT